MKIIYILIILFLLSIITSTTILAQDNCVVKLNEAEKLYESGNIEQIPDLISGCIESGFNRENKIQALRLLTLVNIFEDNTVKAEKNILQLLKIDPEYKVNKAVDPVEFIRLFNSFNTAPVFSIGIVGGVLFTKPYLIESFSRNDFYSTNTKYSSGGASFNIGIKGIYHINSISDVSFEPSFSYLTYQVEENITSPNKATLTETMSYINFPLFGSYYFYKLNNAKFYAEAGLSYDMFLSGNISGIIAYNNNEQPSNEPPTISTKDIRKKYNLTGSVGVGAKFDLNRSNFQINMRYKFGLMNIGSTDMLNATNENLIWEYQYRDNEFSLNNLCIMMSYNREFYIHRKKPSNQTNYDVIK